MAPRAPFPSPGLRDRVVNAPLPPSLPGSPALPVSALVHARTDTGRVRPHNEDAFLVADLEAGTTVSVDGETLRTPVPPHGLLFLVADGMGGAASGELASSMGSVFVLEALLAQWTPAPPSVEAFVEALRDATMDANGRLHRFAQEHPEHRGMGTTLTVAGVLGDRLYLVQVGDSRAYLVRDGEARQLTRDQSLTQRLVELGEITAEQAETSVRRNIILQALGPEAQVVVDLTHQPLRHGDTLVLCSDGLSGLVSPADLATAVSSATDLATLTERLVAQANDRGGPDNITVVAVRFEGDGLSPVQAGDPVGYTVYPLSGTLSDGASPMALSPALASHLRADPTPRFGTPVPPPEVIAQARAAAAGATASAAASAATSPSPVESAPDALPLAERRARALPVQVALALLGASALLWAVATLLGR